jgi:hypothetical protein
MTVLMFFYQNNIGSKLIGEPTTRHRPAIGQSIADTAIKKPGPVKKRGTGDVPSKNLCPGGAAVFFKYFSA